MKKKILGGIAVLAVAALAAWNLNLDSKTNGMSDVKLANVEALADTEGGSSGTFTCYSTYNDCWFWNCTTIYRCGNPCTDAKADSYGDIGQCS